MDGSSHKGSPRRRVLLVLALASGICSSGCGSRLARSLGWEAPPDPGSLKLVRAFPLERSPLDLSQEELLGLWKEARDQSPSGDAFCNFEITATVEGRSQTRFFSVASGRRSVSDQARRTLSQASMKAVHREADRGWDQIWISPYAFGPRRGILARDPAVVDAVLKDLKRIGPEMTDIGTGRLTVEVILTRRGAKSALSLAFLPGRTSHDRSALGAALHRSLSSHGQPPQRWQAEEDSVHPEFPLLSSRPASEELTKADLAGARPTIRKPWPVPTER